MSTRFTEAEPEGVSETMQIFNDEMLMRAMNRPRTRDFVSDNLSMQSLKRQ